MPRRGYGFGFGRRRQLRDTVAPAITSSSTASVAENAVLANALTANEAVTWSIVGGADQARFEISGTTLRWLGNGTKDYEVPNDADTNNTYVVTVRATDLAGNSSDQAITVTVTDVLEVGGSSNPNLLTAPEDFTNAAWFNGGGAWGTFTANAVNGPTGTLTAEKFVEFNGFANHQFRQAYTPGASAKHWFSIHLKAGERTSARVFISDLAGNEAYVDANLAAGTIGSVFSAAGTLVDAQALIVDAGNGWYRVIIGGTCPNATIFSNVRVLNPGNAYTGDGTSGLYVWGAKLEQAAAPSVYP